MVIASQIHLVVLCFVIRSIMWKREWLANCFLYKKVDLHSFTSTIHFILLFVCGQLPYVILITYSRMVYKSPFPPVPVCTESLPSKLLRAIKKHGDLHPTKHALVCYSLNKIRLTFCLPYTSPNVTENPNHNQAIANNHDHVFPQPSR